jgi:hypothetical protein
MKKTLIIIAILCVASFALFRCKNKGMAGTENGGTIDTNFTINFKPVPPSDLDTGADPKKQAEFAWEEFLALNWKSAYSATGKRDFPDTTWTYESEAGAYPDLNVWETFAHRTELRPYSNKMLPFDTAPHYSFGDTLTAGTSALATSFKLFNNLDENNEIGSCDMYAHADAFQKQYQVLYEAKVNRDEYEYILNNYPDTLSLHIATRNTKRNIAKYSAYYPNANTTCSSPKADSVICLPCGTGAKTGAMEIKAAWRRLTKLDDPTKFFTRKVIYYTVGAGNKVIYNNITYALIALHIIHKTQNYPAFVFATFEHVNVESDSMRYVLLNAKGNEVGPLRIPMRDPIRPITAASTRYVHSKLPAKSIWQNYRLVGVQAKPTSDSTSTATNFFLSNYVVESDYTLNHFNGSGIGNPHDHGFNLLYKGKLYSMGGCQGCHGAGQKSFGTDFSFLLDTVGKPVQTPDIGIRNNVGKLARFISAFKLADKK